MAEIKVATDANFEELVLKSERPVVVDFWAAWCGPCKMVAPEMEKLADKYEGSVDVVKVDVDANPGLSQAFNILSIPVIAFFKPGSQPQGVVGFRRSSSSSRRSASPSTRPPPRNSVHLVRSSTEQYDEAEHGKNHRDVLLTCELEFQLGLGLGSQRRARVVGRASVSNSFLTGTRSGVDDLLSNIVDRIESWELENDCPVSAVWWRSKCRPSVLRPACVGLLCLALGIASWAAPAHKEKSLHIYFVDVEGGQATLFVTPAGQSLLIDTGWPGNDGRDASRIVAAAAKAGISKIDYVLITHFHQDHVGGVTQLAARIPIGTFIDHGENRETGNAATVRDFQSYQAVLATGKYKHITARPGDVLPIKGMRATIVSSDGALIHKPLAGAGQDNPNCKGAEQYPADTTENLRSLGTFIQFGKLKVLDLAILRTIRKCS